jgi:2-oxoisovalerate dehydrogenase E1 component
MAGMTDALRTRLKDLPVPKERLLEWWRLMSLERALADGVAERNRSGNHLRLGTTPSGRGQEAIPIGICTALRRVHDQAGPPDIIVNSLSSQHFIAMGMDPARLMAESYGKATGYSRGKAGHLRTALEFGIYGHQGVIGADFGASVGLALASKWQGEGRIVVCGFGDGASNQGKFHEAANFAALHTLPLLFVCVNNHFATSVPVWVSTATENIAQRAQAYGFPGRTVEGNDIFEVHAAAREAIDYVRAGNGPYLLELKTLRLNDVRHVGQSDRLDVDYWRGRDPLALFQQRVTSEGWIEASELDRVAEAAADEARSVFAFVDSSPDPEPGEILSDGPVPPPELIELPSEHVQRDLSYQEGIREVLQQAMRQDPSVYIIGEDIRASLHNTTTQGLVDEFGPDRVIDTPIIEGVVTGAAIGTALLGYRPVVELGLMSYTTPAIEEIASIMANLRSISGGRYTLPVTVRTNLAAGGGPTFGATNTQSWHAWFVHVPNLKVAVPATPADAAGLLQTAILDDNPVLVVEHRSLYTATGPVPEPILPIPFGQAVIRRRGDAATILAVSVCVSMCLEAAEKLAADGIEIEVVDPRTLEPFDFDTLAHSVQRTGSLVVVDVGYRTAGVGTWLQGEMAVRYPGLVQRAAIIASPDATVPYSNALTPHFFPTPASIERDLRAFLDGRPSPAP